MKRLILVLSLAALACSLPAQIPSAKNKPTVQPSAKILPTLTGNLPTVATVTADALHVRTAPMGLRVGYIYHGDIIELSGRCQDGWAEIRWKNADAWVNADYLSDNKCKE